MDGCILCLKGGWRNLFLSPLLEGSGSSTTPLPLRKVSPPKRLKSPLKPFQRISPLDNNNNSHSVYGKAKTLNKHDPQHFVPGLYNPHLSPDCHTAMLSTLRLLFPPKNRKNPQWWNKDVFHTRRRGHIAPFKRDFVRFPLVYIKHSTDWQTHVFMEDSKCLTYK